MPLINLYNWPTAFGPINTTAERKERLWQSSTAISLREAAVAAEMPGIDSVKNVTVCFPGRQVLPEHKVLIIMVEDLFVREDRTQEHCEHLARMLGEEAHKHLPPDWTVDVMIRRFDRESETMWSTPPPE